MGRELQKKKNKSGIAKVRQKPKSKRNPILANALIAASWDKKQTLSQNYRRLGLATRLNGHTGGVDKKAAAPDAVLPAAVGTLDVKTSKLPTQFGNHEATIERDPSSGAILRILDQDLDTDVQLATRNLPPLHDPLNSLDTLDEDVERPFADQHHISGHVGRAKKSASEPESDFLRKLEKDAARPGAKKARKQSQKEQEWCRDLFEKHGQNWSAMFRDSRLNVMQQSEGELKRRITKWLEHSGPKDSVLVDE